MARTKTPAKQKSSEEPTSHVEPPILSFFPAQLRFPVLVLVNTFLSSALYTLVSPFTKGDLATVSAHRDQWWEIAILLVWKAVELAVGWWGGYDTTDLTSLILLSHLPYQFFLISFYKIRPTSAATCLAIDIFAASVPFYLLRATSAYHKLKTPKGAAANRSIIDDIGVQISTSLLATGIYGVVLYGSFGTWLPKYLVTHFEGIRDISALYDAKFMSVLAVLVPTGLAAKTFLFTPTMAAKPDEEEEQATAKFDPETATLGETIIYNFWGYSKRVKVLVKRAAALIVVGSVHTWLHTYGAVEGAEGFGAVGWSAIWAGAAALTSLAFLVVGDVEGVTN